MLISLQNNFKESFAGREQNEAQMHVFSSTSLFLTESFAAQMLALCLLT